MKSFIVALIVAVFAEQAQAVVIKTSDPIPEKPDQYNRVCDMKQADIGDCWAGNDGPYAGAHPDFKRTA